MAKITLLILSDFQTLCKTSLNSWYMYPDTPFWIDVSGFVSCLAFDEKCENRRMKYDRRRPTDVAAVTAFILLQLRTLQWAISKERKISWKSGPTTCLWRALFLLMLCFAKLRLYDDPIHRIPSEKYYQETRGGLKVANLACCWSFITSFLFIKKKIRIFGLQNNFENA